MNLGRKAFAAPLAAFTLIAGGSIALAATDGGFPGVGGNDVAASHRPTTVPVGAPTDKPTNKPTDEPTDQPADEPNDGPNDGGTATPTPSLVGLCHAYRAGGYASSTKNGNVNPAFTALEDAAGGSANIGSYCDAKLGPAKVKPTHEPKPEKTAKPEKPAKPEQADHSDKSQKDEHSDGANSDGGSSHGDSGSSHADGHAHQH